MIFVDTNILVDLDSRLTVHAWSENQFALALQNGPVVTNHIVLAEFAGRFAGREELATHIAALRMEVRPLDTRAAFIAGVAWQAYRRAGGPRLSMIPDFLIGGHAITLGATLLTRDARRFARYFPELTLITPETQP